MLEQAARLEAEAAQARVRRIRERITDAFFALDVKRAFDRNKIANPLWVAGNGVEALRMLRDGQTVRIEGTVQGTSRIDLYRFH